jgi:hypothetical protein
MEPGILCYRSNMEHEILVQDPPDPETRACAKMCGGCYLTLRSLYPIVQTMFYVAFCAVAYKTDVGIRGYSFFDAISLYIALFDFLAAIVFITWGICKRVFLMFLTGFYSLMIGVSYATLMRWPPPEHIDQDPYYTRLLHGTIYHFIGVVIVYAQLNAIAKEELRRLQSVAGSDLKSV